METEVISPQPETTVKKAGRKEWIGLAVIALPCMLYSMDLTVLNLALPALSADLKPTSTQLLWIVDIYGFMVAGSLITMDTLGDRIGRRKLLMIGAFAFGVASVLAAFSNSPNLLIFTRALLGIAGATLAPSTLSLISNMFHDADQRTFAIGVWATSYSVGGAIGPLLGGLMLEHFSWGSVFLIGVPVMLLLLILGPILLPEFKDPKAERLDLISTVMCIATVLTVIFSLKQVAHQGLDLITIIALLAATVGGYFFIKRQQRLAHPFIDLQLFRSSAFNTALTMNLLTVMVAFGSFFFIAQYLQMVLGLTPLQAGLWTLPSSAGFVLGSMFTPAVAAKFRKPYVIGVGLTVSAIGFGMLTQIETGGLPLLVVGSTLFSLGMSPAVILSTDLIVGSAPAERSGSAASLSETGAELGGASGIAIFGSIGTIVYRNFLSDEIPESFSPSVVNQAKQTLGGALEVAGGLNTSEKTTLIEAARDAFTTAFAVNAGIGAAIVLGIAVLATTKLKNK